MTVTVGGCLVGDIADLSGHYRERYSEVFDSVDTADLRCLTQCCHWISEVFNTVLPLDI